MTRRSMAAAEKVTLLLNLIAYLRTHGAVPVTHLADHFEVSPELIRTLASFIGTAGVPGDAGTYQHQDLYDIDWDALETEDIVELKHVVGVDGTPRFTSLQASALLAGLHSLDGVLGPEDIEVVASAERKLRMASQRDGTALTMSGDVDPLGATLTIVRESISEHTQLGFSYLDSSGNASQRNIDAHRLVQIEGAWYVEGWCHDREAMRTFRVDFMRNVEPTKTAQLHPAAPTTRTQMSVDHAQGITVELLVSDEHVYRIASWKPKRIGRGAGNRARLAVTLIHESRVIPLVCAAPGHIEVVAPASMRSIVKQWAEEIARGAVDPGTEVDSAEDWIH